MVVEMVSTTLQQELTQLSREERLQLAHWLLDSLVVGDDAGAEVVAGPPQPLMRWAGMFAGGGGNTAVVDEEILEAEIDPITGWGGQ